MKNCSKQELKKILLEKKLPSHDDILQLCDSVSEFLDTEITWYRQACDIGAPGCLLDFQSGDLPTIVVPDLHGRGHFLFDIINFKLPHDFLKGKSSVSKASSCRKSGLTVLKALEKGLIRLIFVGDILHTERNTKTRWLLAQEDYIQENFTGEAMSAEMAESLSLWYGVFYLKQSFPENCHILKGNHENILNASVNGDFSFRKFANEGAMVKAFVQEYYGDDVIYMIHCVEDALPLVVVTNQCVISHAEPYSGFSKEKIINGKKYPNVVSGLTWTDNDQAQENSVINVIKNLAAGENIDDYVYLGGHRCVTGKYEYRQNGRFIQIHNPGEENVALVYLGRKFNPEYDLVSVSSCKDKKK